ncbi:glutamine-rich protein 2-like isoform X2 [Pomacea canaliculata]|uniref:glutamine-rich protein 2-like isoform X2 n=1 Tax=Pomacea canaliculata TaxID=400727 RepID=UPI000D72E763|nr:glutamine-rich protein 2-like isoform X2 [Pomacea canaliculata]
MSISVSLPEMVDLALGTPEMGAVNFNILHKLLHAMIVKLNIQDAKGFINAHDHEYLQSSVFSGTDLTSRSGIKIASSIDVESDVEKKDNVKGMETINLLNDRQIVSKLRYLEGRITQLSRSLEELNSLPTTQDLMNKIQKTEDIIHPVSEMWQLMQLKKNMIANQEGIDKLMTITEDILSDLGKMREDFEDPQKNENNIRELEQQMEEMKTITTKGQENFDTFKIEMEQKIESLTDVINDCVLWHQLEEALLGINTRIDSLQRAALRASSTPGSVSQQPSSGEIGEQEETEETEVALVEAAVQTSTGGRYSVATMGSRKESQILGRGPSTSVLEMLEKLGELLTSYDTLSFKVSGMEDKMKLKEDQLEMDTKNELTSIQNELARVKDSIVEAQRNALKSSDTLSRLEHMLLEMEAEIERLSSTALEQQEASSQKDTELENKLLELFEQCDLLKDQKADKEFVQMEVHVKADKEQLEGKVNHSVFNLATEEINKMIKEILDQIAGNQGEWKDTFTKLTNDVDGKLDRMELTPLKDWLERKLRILNKKIEQGKLEWNDDTAAGLRRQLLQHYHCLSCDKPMDIMPTGAQPSLPAGYPLPPTRSPRPYTTFELDHIRQHTRRIYSGAYKPGCYGTTEIVDFYATTRPCGGAHTLTYPHRRISKITNISQLFRDDDGEIVALDQKEKEMDVLGANGQIYRGRLEEAGLLEAKMPSNNKFSRPQTSQNARQRPVSARAPSGGRNTPQVRPPSSHQPRPQSALLSNMRMKQTQNEELSQPDDQTDIHDGNVVDQERRNAF